VELLINNDAQLAKVGWTSQLLFCNELDVLHGDEKVGVKIPGEKMIYQLFQDNNNKLALELVVCRHHFIHLN
jgi:hypothetical protein